VQQTYHLLQQVLDLQSTCQFKEMYGESNIIQQWHRLLTNTVKSCVFWGTSPAAAPCWSDILRCRIEPWSILLQIMSACKTLLVTDPVLPQYRSQQHQLSCYISSGTAPLRCGCKLQLHDADATRWSNGFLNFFFIFLKSDAFETEFLFRIAFH